MSLSQPSDPKSEMTLAEGAMSLPGFRSIFGCHFEALDGLLSIPQGPVSQPCSDLYGVVMETTSRTDFSDVLDRLATSLDSPSDFEDRKPVFFTGGQEQCRVLGGGRMNGSSEFGCLSDEDASSYFAMREGIMTPAYSRESLVSPEAARYSMTAINGSSSYGGAYSAYSIGKDGNYQAAPILHSPALSTVPSHHSLNTSFSALELPRAPRQVLQDTSLSHCYTSSSAIPSSLIIRPLLTHEEEGPVIPSSSSDPRETKFACPIPGCGKVFTRKANRRAHMSTHNPDRSRPFACSLCPKAYLRSVDLIRHQETIHEKSKKHTCTGCNRYFTRKEGLKKHLEKAGCVA
jgi:hypothetical protein